MASIYRSSPCFVLISVVTSSNCVSRHAGSGIQAGGQRSKVRGQAQRSGDYDLGAVGGDVMYVTGVALTETRPLSPHLLTAGCWEFVKLEVEHSGTPAHYVTGWVGFDDSGTRILTLHKVSSSPATENSISRTSGQLILIDSSTLAVVAVLTSHSSGYQTEQRQGDARPTGR